MSERGGEWFEDEDGPFWWPRCEVAGCAWFVCHGLSRTRCYKHAKNGPVQSLMRNALKGSRRALADKDTPREKEEKG